MTVHATHEALVLNNVGYNAHGHGYFLEDGYENENQLIGNLGIVVKPGIILPSERGPQICGLTGDAWNFQNYTRSDMCQVLANRIA